MLDQVSAQVGHVALVRVELDEVGGDEGGARHGLGAGPGAVVRARGELGPGKGAEQGAVLLGDGIGGNPGGQRPVGVGERTRGVRQGGGRGRPAPVGEGGVQPVEGWGQNRYHVHGLHSAVGAV